LIEAFAGRLDVKLLSQPHAGPAAARNRGAAGARGEFLAFTDDDCTPASDWLEKLAARFEATPHCAVGGKTVNGLANNIYAEASQLLSSYLYDYYNADPVRAGFLTSNNIAFPAGRFRALGGFDETFRRAAAEDRDICDRWLHAGYGMIFAPEAVVHHFHELTLRSFWGQHFWYGRGAYYFYRARARRGGGGFRPEPLAFYLNMLRYPFRQASPRPAVFLSILLVIARLASVSGHVWERIGRKIGFLRDAGIGDNRQ
jgi:GT2 family glycosyltransferase